MTDKAALRRAIREEAKTYSDEERRIASAKVCALLRAQSLWQTARSVLIFAPMTDEPDISPLLTEGIENRKTVALPAYSQSARGYNALQVRDPQRDLAPGQFGILEPCAGCAPIPLTGFDLILVPGLAFSRDGHRLGRGKGFYDRLLAQTSSTKCAVAFDWQLVADVPHEAHDITVDYIATPSQLLVVGGR